MNGNKIKSQLIASLLIDFAFFTMLFFKIKTHKPLNYLINYSSI